jgi:crotonobetainyl-CoA:carnitine CoA-transferase CaiB-like acyl-CoA transferase
MKVPSEAGEVELLKSPFDNISGWETPSGAIPSAGQHTAEVLAELGIEFRPNAGGKGRSLGVGADRV